VRQEEKHSELIDFAKIVVYGAVIVVLGLIAAFVLVVSCVAIAFEVGGWSPQS
jgi:hypothetical protein